MSYEGADLNQMAKDGTRGNYSFSITHLLPY